MTSSYSGSMNEAHKRRRQNEFNDKEELEALATAIKEVYFQDYKTTYDNHTEIDKSHFLTM